MKPCFHRRAFKSLSPLGSAHLLVADVLPWPPNRTCPRPVDDGRVGLYEVTDPSILPVVGQWMPNRNCRFLRWMTA